MDDGTSEIFDPSVIDLVSTSPDDATVIVWIVVDRPWTGSDAQLRSLQEKIHSYVGFILDGQLAATHPSVAGLPWEIGLHCQTGPPDARTAAMLDALVAPLQGYGGTLTVVGR